MIKAARAARAAPTLGHLPASRATLPIAFTRSASTSTQNTKPKRANSKEKLSRFPRLGFGAEPYFNATDGTFTTTVEIKKWFEENDIHHDPGQALQIQSPETLKKALKGIGVTVGFSPMHIVHPHYLMLFTVRREPSHFSHRYNYERMKKEPLWIHNTFAAASVFPVVKTTTSRRFKAALLMGLKDLGYSSTGIKALPDGNHRVIRGTLLLRFFNPIAALQGPLKETAAQLAQQLDAAYSTVVHTRKQSCKKDWGSVSRNEKPPRTDPKYAW